MSSIESAPATIPPTSEATFKPAFAPLSVGTLRCWSARSRSPADSASASTGTRPPVDTRSDHRRLPRSPAACERVSPQRCPLRSVESLLEELRFSRHARAFSFYGTRNRRSSSVDPGLGLSGTTGRSRHGHLPLWLSVALGWVVCVSCRDDLLRDVTHLDLAGRGGADEVLEGSLAVEAEAGHRQADGHADLLASCDGRVEVGVTAGASESQRGVGGE